MKKRLAPLLLLALVAAAGPAPRIESFSPEGLAKAVRQVAVRFSQPMVAFGDPRPPLELFTIDCPEKGVARWVDERSWVYDFAKDLPAGLACRFVLRPDARGLAGARVSGRREFRFTTGGPAVLTMQPWPGSRVAEDQRFLLRLDAAPEPRSVEAHVHFRVEGQVDPVGVRVVPGADEDFVIEARQRFPAGRRIELVWDRGVATATGVATSEAQRFEFRVREALGLTLSCPRENAHADCLPFGALELVFSAPVAADAARRIRLVPLAGAGASKAPEPAYDHEGGDFIAYWQIRGPFAPKSRYRLELPAELRDDAGRPLPPPDPRALEIAIAELPPLAKFAARFGVVEAAAPVLPVTLRRIEPEALPAGASLDLAGTAADLAAPTAEQVLAWLRASPSWDWSTRGQSIFARLPAAPERRSFALPPPASADSTEVIGIPLEGLGLHVVEIESRALGLAHFGADRPMYASAVALVTNLSVHFKWGRESSLAWVTSLDRGRPVAGASVAVFDCDAKPLASGTTDEDGLVRLTGLPAPESDRPCYRESTYDSGLLVMARQDRDVSFVHTSWEQGIELYRFAVPMTWAPVTALAHTVLDRALFRAGETVHMKHLLRRPVLAGFTPLPDAERPTLLRIQHVGSDDAGRAAGGVRDRRQRALGVGDPEGREARRLRADAGAARRLRGGRRARARVGALPRRGVPLPLLTRRDPAARGAVGGPARVPARRRAPLSRRRRRAAARDDAAHAAPAAQRASSRTTTASRSLAGSVQEGILAPELGRATRRRRRRPRCARRRSCSTPQGGARATVAELPRGREPQRGAWPSSRSAIRTARRRRSRVRCRSGRRRA